jgi:hypothetical protein
VRWASRTGGVAHLMSGAVNLVDPTDEVASHLSLALHTGSMGAVTYAHAQVARAAYARLKRGGQVIYQAYDATAPLSASVDRVREALIANSAQTRLGFVATNPVWALGWEDRRRILPTLPTIPASALRENTPLWRRFVPDAHGMQLLTEEHLDNATDLSTWHITEVTAGRYLVEAADLSEWLSSGGPRESVLAKARADFGDAIIPPDALT